jgi:hypothetical protein
MANGGALHALAAHSTQPRRVASSGHLGSCSSSQCAASGQLAAAVAAMARDAAAAAGRNGAITARGLHSSTSSDMSLAASTPRAGETPQSVSISTSGGDGGGGGGGGARPAQTNLRILQSLLSSRLHASDVGGVSCVALEDEESGSACSSALSVANSLKRLSSSRAASTMPANFITSTAGAGAPPGAALWQSSHTAMPAATAASSTSGPNAARGPLQQQPRRAESMGHPASLALSASNGPAALGLHAWPDALHTVPVPVVAGSSEGGEATPLHH